MEKSRLKHKKIVRRMYKDTREEERATVRAHLKSINAVYKGSYELVMGYEMPRSYGSISREGPNYRMQGATLNGQKL